MTGTVAITGAGLAGLTTGLAFAMNGWQVRVFEQDDCLRTQRTGVYLWESCLRTLDALGVLHLVTAEAVPVWRYEKRDRDGAVLARCCLGPNFRLYVPVHETLVRVLSEALSAAGGEIVFGSRVIDANPDGSLVFDDGSCASTDLVVAADGIDSLIRGRLGLLRDRRPVGQVGYGALIPRTKGEVKCEAGRAHCEHWNGSRRLVYAPCTEDRAYVQLISVAGDNPPDSRTFDRDFWHALFPDLGWIIDRLPDDGSSEWFETARATRWVKGRVALVGDAASSQAPFLGQNAGCAIATGFTLAEAVTRAGDIPTGLAEWQRSERGFTERVGRIARRYGQLALLPPTMRNAVLQTIDRSDWLKRVTLLVAARRDPTGSRAAAETTELDWSYLLPLGH